MQSSILLAALALFPALQDPVFDAAVIELDVDVPPFRRLFDFDADGDLDALGHIYNGTSSRWASVYENDGAGNFTRPFYLGGQGSMTSQLGVTGRFNADGLDDFALATGGYPFSSVTFYLSTGSSFTFDTHLLVGPFMQVLEAGDFNGDGRDDLVYTNQTEIAIALAGTGAIHSVPHGFANSSVHTIRTLDADGDLDLDILLGTDARVGLVLVDLGADPVLTLGATWSHGLPTAMMDVGDVDGDLDVDVALFGMNDPAEFRILRRTGPSSFDLEAPGPGGPAEYLFDIDADGDLDGVCCGGGGTPQIPRSDDPSDFQIALNDGAGLFEESFQVHGVGSPQLAGVGDMDGDGDVDLVGGRCVYYAPGTIQPPPTAMPDGQVPVVSHPRELGDFDGDGDIDAGLSVEGVQSNDGSGYFTMQVPALMDTPRGARFAGPGFPGDFDGDGDLDLLVEMKAETRGGAGKWVTPAVLGRNRIGTRAWLLRNDGSGALLDGGPAAPPGVLLSLGDLEAGSSLPADLDLDGDLDLVTSPRAYANSEAISRLWINTGGGSFVPLTELSDERVEHVADLDLDGVPDLVTKRSYGNHWQLSVQRGHLDRAFPTYDPLHDVIQDGWLRYLSDTIAFGDVDDDGYLDMVFLRHVLSTGGNYHEPVILRDTQSGGGYGYVVETVLQSGENWYPGTDYLNAGVLLGDVDGDGAQDIVLGGRNENVRPVEVRLRQPGVPLGFDAALVQVFGPGAPGFFADVDGDGDPDLIGLLERLVYNVSVP